MKQNSTLEKAEERSVLDDSLYTYVYKYTYVGIYIYKIGGQRACGSPDVK